jgi:hypothetical protein
MGDDGRRLDDHRRHPGVTICPGRHRRRETRALGVISTDMPL